jgi:hypothetical protein
MEMSQNASSTAPPPTEGRVVVPTHVVHRRFPTETVVLNLRTGKYHGLNATAGEMLEQLAETGSITRTATSIAAEYGREIAEVEADLRDLVAALAERGLIEIESEQE